jgi:1-acyl-sn-glycerol-3-phosphate acyltransferase
LRFVLRPVFRLLFHLLSRIRIIGKENIPANGAYLIAINHISLFEPPFILAFWPTAPEGAGAVDIWDRAGQSTLVRLYGGIPVHRGQYDRSSITRLLAVLKSGRPLLIAPEGGRSHSLGMMRGLPGAAYLAENAQVPVVPVGIIGTSDDFLSKALKGHRGSLEIHIGRPFTLPPTAGRGGSRSAARQANADLIMRKIAELLPPEYYGVYGYEADSILVDDSEIAKGGPQDG